MNELINASEAYEKFEKYLNYYDLCEDGRKSLKEAAKKICGDYNMLSDAFKIKKNLADLSVDFNSREGLKDKSLQFCVFAFTLAIEDMEKLYRAKNIPHDILIDTVSDFAVWINRDYEWYGEWGLSQYGWLSAHLRGRVFKLGRLQFNKNKVFDVDIYKNLKSGELKAVPESDKLNETEWEAVLRIGEPTLSIHIPKGGKLDEAACLDSFDKAKKFFRDYFDYDFKAFSCVSWLLDHEFVKLLPPESNILKFQNMFVKWPRGESYGGLDYMFANITRENIKDAPMDTSFRKKIVEHVSSGGKMHCNGGYILINN